MKTLSWLVSVGLLASTSRVVTFDSFPLGKTPPGWTVAMTNRGRAPQWEIRRDGSAATQPYVLAQVSTDSNGERSPLAILDNMSLRDGDVSVRIKPVSGHEFQAGGLVWRYHDSNNYYLARANALENNVAVFKVQNGKFTQILPGVKHDLPGNGTGWSILKVSVRGNHFQVFLDHRRILQGTDNTFIGSGGVGLWTGADSVTYFDDFRVYAR
jgi:hypothetical protein